MTKGSMPLLLRYSESWRTQRSFFHHVASTKAATGYASELEIEAIRMMRDLIRDPSDYDIIFKCYSGGIILRLAFGVRIESGRDPKYQSSLKAVRDLKRVASPAQYLVDLLPALKYIPDFPAPWKTELKELQNEHEAFFRKMLDNTKNDHKAGQWRLDDLTTAYMFGGLLESGSDTSGTTLMSFYLLMTRHPGQLEILQQELDRVDGYFFQGGAIFHANQWAIHRNPEKYPDAESFNAQRWLDPRFQYAGSL
ncbi:hypothetical protein ACHAQJ_004071 [Trichoderma viride]